MQESNVHLMCGAWGTRPTVTIDPTLNLVRKSIKFMEQSSFMCFSHPGCSRKSLPLWRTMAHLRTHKSPLLYPHLKPVELVLTFTPASILVLASNPDLQNLSMVLWPSVGPWPLFQFFVILHSR
jgi:hypothetical protein